MRKNRFRALAASVACVALCLLPGATPTASAGGPYLGFIEGTGSTWSQNALNQWIADVASDGIQVAYGGGGSSQGRQDFGNDTVDFAVTEIPFQGRDPRTGQSDSANGRRVPPTCRWWPVARRSCTTWRSAGSSTRACGCPARRSRRSSRGTSRTGTTPRSPLTTTASSSRTRRSSRWCALDGSGTTAQLTTWMDNQYPSLWRPFCGCSGLTSYYPIKDGFVAKDGSVGVASHISASYGNGTIGYVEYSYALNDNYPVAKMLNKAGYYVLPTAYNVAVALTQAKINEDKSVSAVPDPDPHRCLHLQRPADLSALVVLVHDRAYRG